MYFFYWQELKFRGLYSLTHWLLSLGLIYYYKDALIAFSAPTFYYIVTNLFEAIWASFQLSLCWSIVLCFPLILAQAYFFVRPALYEYEIPVANRIFITLICFSFAGFFGLLTIFPKFWSILITTSIEEKGLVSIYLETNLQKYVMFLTNSLYFLFLFFIFLIGMSPTVYRKLPYFIIFLLAFIVSPPDLLIVFTIVTFCVVLYELMLWIICIYRIYTGKALRLNSTPIVKTNQAKDKGRKTFHPKVIS